MSIWLSEDGIKSRSVTGDVITGGRLAFSCDRNRRDTRFVSVDLPPVGEERI